MKKKSAIAMPEVVEEFFAALLDGMISVYMLLIIAIMPFYFEEGFVHIGTDKAMFYQSTGRMFVLFTIPVWLLLSIFQIINHKRNKEPIRVKLSATDWFALLYAVALLLSYIFSDYKEQCLWGARGWYMGLIPQLFFLYGYFMISHYWERRDWMFYLFFPVSFIVFGLGSLNRFGIFPIDMKVENPAFISTIGNINWYCGYQVTVFFAGCYLFIMKEWKARWQKWLMGAYLVVGYASLLVQGSESGLVALAAATLVLFNVAAKKRETMLAFWQEMVLLSGACVGLEVAHSVKKSRLNYFGTFTKYFVNSYIPIVAFLIAVACLCAVMFVKSKKQQTIGTSQKAAMLLNAFCGGAVLLYVITAVLNTYVLELPYTQLHYFILDENWGSYRGAIWKTSMACVGQQTFLHKLIGVGPDGFSAWLYQSGPEAIRNMLERCFGSATLTNAHCEWMTILVNVGILGVVGFVGMITSVIGSARKSKKQDIATACALCLVTYTINNLFSFQQSMNLATVMVILGISRAYLSSETERAKRA